MIVHCDSKKMSHQDARKPRHYDIDFDGDNVLVVSPDKFQRDYNRP